MIIFFSIYSISLIIILFNSYTLCRFNVARFGVLTFIYYSATNILVQNTLTSIFCLLFAKSKYSAFKILSITSLTMQIIIVLLLTYFKSDVKEACHGIFSTMFIRYKYIPLLILLLIVNVCAGWLWEKGLLVKSGSDLKSVLMILIILSVIIISVIVSCSFLKLAVLKRRSLLKKQYRMQCKQYREIEMINSELKSFNHDYLNHIHCIHALLKSGEVIKATEYIEQLYEFQNLGRDYILTGNPVCDAILTDKKTYANKIGATIESNCQISNLIDSVDLCTLLSNALDNSIEACNKSTESKKIKVLAYTQHNFQYIKITNPSNLPYIDFETSKRDKLRHGIGIANIKRIVKKYDGTFSAKNEHGVFTLKIILKIDKILPPPPTKFMVLNLNSKLDFNSVKDHSHLI